MTKHNESDADNSGLSRTQNVTPVVSVITVVRNVVDNLEQTIQSVIKQTYPHIEYIIIDGGSTDGTIDIIKKYESKIAYWISEPDNGIYDAMNKAIRVMRGEGHLFLNAGDYFVGNVFPDHPRMPCFIPVYRKNVLGRTRLLRVKDFRLGLPYCHQGILFESRGVRYDLSYGISADYRYYLDHGYKQLRFCTSTGHIYHDVGFSKKHAGIRDREIASIIRERFSVFWYLFFRFLVVTKNLIRSALRFARNIGVLRSDS